MGSPSFVAGLCPEEEDDSSYGSALSMETDDEELEEELEDVQDSCMLDMVGNRIAHQETFRCCSQAHVLQKV